MWLLILITLLNMTADNDAFVLTYRTTIAGFPVNVFDGLVIIAVVTSFIALFGRYPADRVHPLLKWIMATSAVTLIGASVVASSNLAMQRYFLMTFRNFLTLPAAVYLGYAAMKRPSFARWFTYALVVGSVASAVLVIHSAGSAGENIEFGSSFDLLRNTSLGGDAGCYATALALFAFASGAKIFNLPVRILLVIIGVTGAVFYPHRSTWLTFAIVWSVSAFFVAKVRFSRVLFTGLVGAIFVGGVATAGVFAYSQATGKDFTGWVQKRLISMLPGEHDGVQHHAWDTRLPGTIRELEIFAHEPLFGGGFSISDTDIQTHQDITYRHNTWTSFLAETGIVGFSTAVMIVFGTIIAGRRMVRDATDPGSVMLGAICASIGVYYLFAGLMSLTFNVQRHALDLGIACGVVLRCRAMQLTNKRLHANETAYQCSSPQLHPPLITADEYEAGYQPAPW
jgi:hypothetical protein